MTRRCSLLEHRLQLVRQLPVGLPASFIGINGINDLDFSSRDARLVFEGITIKRAFIVYQPPVTRHSMTDGSEYCDSILRNYINCMTEFLREHDVPFVFAPVAPNVALKTGGCIVDIPTFVDRLAFNDPENALVRAVRECRIAGHSFIEHAPGAMVHSFTAKEASAFILNRGSHRYFALRGNTNITVDEAVRVVLRAAGLASCNVSFGEYPHRIETPPNAVDYVTIGGSRCKWNRDD
jgi:hypothetical protein